MSWQLAQVNIARTKAPFSAPAMAGLTSRIAEMNSLAESSPGFVWRFTSEVGDDNRLDMFADYFAPFDRDCFFFNMSVWRSVEDLHHFAFKTTHLELFRNRHSWVEPFSRAHAALWWVSVGSIPTVREARARLLALDQDGPTPLAFTFARPFPTPATAGTDN